MRLEKSNESNNGIMLLKEKKYIYIYCFLRYTIKGKEEKNVSKEKKLSNNREPGNCIESKLEETAHKELILSCCKWLLKSN